MPALQYLVRISMGPNEETFKICVEHLGVKNPVRCQVLQMDPLVDQPLICFRLSFGTIEKHLQIWEWAWPNSMNLWMDISFHTK